MAFNKKALKDTILANVGGKASRSAARASIDSVNKANFLKLTKPARDRAAADARTKAVSASVSQSAREAQTKLTAAKPTPKPVAKPAVSKPVAKPAASKPTGAVQTKAGAFPVYKKDSAQAGSFRAAFAEARAKGKTVFSWNGRSYNTKVK